MMSDFVVTATKKGEDVSKNLYTGTLDECREYVRRQDFSAFDDDVHICNSKGLIVERRGDKLRFGGLACVSCGSPLDLSIGYTGADWDCEAGDGSGYGYEVALSCPHCGRIYHIGNVKNRDDFSPKK